MDRFTTHCVLAFLLFFNVIQGVLCATGTYRLVTTLMQNYSKVVRPAESPTDPIVVRYGVALQQIIDMDERNQILTTNVWLRQHWTDASLRWNSEDFDGIKKITLPSTDIWKPDIVLYNIADDKFEGIMKTNAEIEDNGQVSWYAPAIFKSSCKIKIRFFPFDEQRCKLELGSWAFTTNHLDLVNRTDAGDIASFIHNGEWVLKGMPLERKLIKYNCCKYPYSLLHFTIIVQRRSLFYVFNMLVPCMLVSALTMLSFYLPADAGEKVTLCITILLSLTVFLLLVAETMPPTSDVIPLIAQYYLTTMILVSVSTLMTVVVLHIHHKGVYASRPPAWLRKLTVDYLAQVLCLRSCRSLHGAQTVPRISFENAPAMREVNNTVYKPVNMDCNQLEMNNMMTSKRDVLGMGRRNRLQQTLDLIAINLGKIVERYEEEDMDKEMRCEWIRIAYIIDRLFMWMFGLTTVIATLSIFLQVPSFG
ncbi:neuronal acetylcholine receptor subunit alpha-10-like isoform X2 [Acanthaster planci]|uniref:Neuronal acetylcholine receptor subunit alpha-10-like isoform X2 n=1 Tax=Acanthaster planci TaxID=133434 RepID=A0A8B7YVJ4_ACAPL|nr:neuronal acetylcholine receptor subunit alpha-10-like isoform X2 [Acanthaster planci]